MAKQRKKRNRSPNYPVVSLKSGLDYLERLHNFSNGRHLVPMQAAIEEAWSMKKGSTYGKQVVGALKSFGLIEDTGARDSRKIRVSEAGAKIRGNHSDHDQLLKAAALSPKLHAELWSEFSVEDTLPPGAALRQYLVFDRAGNCFNEATVDDFIAEFLETVKFANLNGKNGSREVDTSNNGNGPETSRGEIKVGSFVQWTSQGVYQFPEAKRIAKIEKHADGTEYAFFEEEGGYAPMSELTTEEQPAEIKLLKPQSRPPLPPADETPEGAAVERWTLDEGPASLTRPDNLSAESVLEFEHSVIGVLNRARRKAGMRRIKVEETGNAPSPPSSKTKE